MNNRYKTLFLTTFLLLTIPAFAVPITTIGILCTDVNSVPECTVEVTMLTSGGFYVLDNPSKGMHECELPTEPRYSGNRRYDPIQKRQWLVVGKQTIENVNVIDEAGTGYSFGIGIVGVFEEVKITVNKMEYIYKGDTKEYYKWRSFLSYLNGETQEEIIFYWKLDTASTHHLFEDCRYLINKDQSRIQKITKKMTEEETQSLKICKTCKTRKENESP